MVDDKGSNALAPGAEAGEGASPFEAAVEACETETGKPGIRWVARDLKPPIFQRAAALFGRGLSVREVKKALGISHGEAGRLRLRAAAGGGNPKIALAEACRPN